MKFTIFITLLSLFFFTVASFGITPDMVFVPAGEFQMGDSFSEGGTNERPVHMVTLDSFSMGKYEITYAQYCDFLNSALSQGLITVTNDVVYKAGSGTSYPYCDTALSSSYSKVIDYSDGVFIVRTKAGRDMSSDPMVLISWYGTVAYCNWLSQQEGKEPCYNLSTWECDFSKNGYRLPTEAEWEYAARGGLAGKRFPWGGMDTITHNQAIYLSLWTGGSPVYQYDVNPTEGYHPIWSNDGILPYTSPVYSFTPNGYGLNNMAGNVWEWCYDWYSSVYYSSSPPNNPTGPTSGTYRVQRGGGYARTAYYCRVAFRDWGGPDYRFGDGGFRVVRNAKPAIEALVDINPDSLNKNSKGQWVTVYITLPAVYDVNKIDANTIAITSLTGTSCQPDYHQAADLSFVPQIGDRDEDGIPDLTVKFNRQELIANLCLDDVAVTVEGKLLSGEYFKGIDHVRVIDRGN